MLDQLQRLRQHIRAEPPPPVGLRLTFSGPVSGDEVLRKTRQVMQLVAIAQSGGWPSDDEWRRRLPPWFLETFDRHTLEQIAAHQELWDFGSWLDAMKNPGWEWWSCLATDHSGLVRAVAQSDPYSIEPLAYLLRAAGAVDVDYQEDS